MHISDIAQILLQPMLITDKKIHHFSIDSRDIEKGSLFFALEGDKVSGTCFLSEVAKKGGTIAVVPKYYRGDSYGLHLFFVENVTVALQKLAQEKINTIAKAHIIGITGSIGKTTSKEYLFALLQNHFSVFHTPKNYNSQIGLPISLLNAPSDHQIYILEMGMSEKGNIQKLVQIAPPTIAWVTQISHSHFSGFSSLNEIAEEKAGIFSSPKLQYRVITQDISQYDSMQSSHDNTIICGRDVELLPQELGFQIRYYRELSDTFSLKTSGKHLLDNFLGAVAIAKLLGISFRDIFASIDTLPVVPHRFEKKSYKGVTFIDDSYNANADSTIAAMHNLPKTSGRKILVFADMHELGSYTEKAHERVASTAVSLIDACFCLGEESKAISDLLIASGKPGYHYTDRELMSDSLMKYIKDGDVVLVKGANQYKLWEIIPN
ncbi:MAG: UDP-N-acetylmuramoyl-tripeptide--D-alanyl-D-alanine ligase [Chlamydiales bacterium]